MTAGHPAVAAGSWSPVPGPPPPSGAGRAPLEEEHSLVQYYGGPGGGGVACEWVGSHVRGGIVCEG